MNSTTQQLPTAKDSRDAQYRRTLFERVKSFLLGDDIFISYARRDSSDYAVALANRLRDEEKFLCYLDQ